MILKSTKLRITDNSGAKWAKCIKILGNRIKATVGDMILITLSCFTNRKKVKKRTIYFGLIVSTRYWVLRKNGFFLKFNNNKVLLFSKQYKFLGTRIYGLLCKEVRLKINNHTEKKHLVKILTYSTTFI